MGSWQGCSRKSLELANSPSTFQLVHLWFVRSCQKQKMLFKIMERAARAPHALPCSRVAFFPSHSRPPPASTALLHMQWCNCVCRSCTFQFCSATFNTTWRCISTRKLVNQNLYINKCLLYINNCLKYLGDIY